MKELIKRIAYLSQGNPGAAVFLTTLYKEAPGFAGPIMSSLADYDITGAKLWVLYKDLCSQDIEQVVKLVMTCPKELLIEACSTEDRSGKELITQYL